MIRALIFDFDGLIVETESPILRAWQETYQAYGLELPVERWQQTIGSDDSAFDALAELTKSVPGLDAKAVNTHRKARELELAQAQPVMPGVMDYLEAGKRLGIKLGVASSSSYRWVGGHLERLGLLAYFDCVITRDKVGKAKPEPDLYLAAIRAFSLRGDQAIALEDAPNGILAAKRAGLYCVAVPHEHTRNLDLSLADLRLNSLAELPLEEMIQRIESFQK